MSKRRLPPAPPSSKVPFEVGEPWYERHRRRKTAAETMREDLEDWAREHGGTLAVHNGGGHYVLNFPSFVVEWWPESGRIVKDKNWGSPAKAHDAEQLRAKVGKYLKKAMDGRPVPDFRNAVREVASREARKLIQANTPEVVYEVARMLCDWIEKKTVNQG